MNAYSKSRLKVIQVCSNYKTRGETHSYSNYNDYTEFYTWAISVVQKYTLQWVHCTHSCLAGLCATVKLLGLVLYVQSHLLGNKCAWACRNIV